MKFRSVVIVLVVLVAVLSLILLFVYRNNLSLSPENNESCNLFHFSGENKPNLVFITTEDNVKKYMDYLATVKPFGENDFNVYYEDDFTPECSIYQDKAVLCNNREIVRKASACPNDYLIVPVSQPANIRSSSYMNILSMNTNHPLTVFPHELAHLIANLADEYVPATIPSNSQNCQSKCTDFEEKNLGCFQGCSKDSYFRAEQAGIMRTLSAASYGNYDEAIISSFLNKNSPSITGNAISEADCTQNQLYIIEGLYNSSDNSIKLTSKTKAVGCSGTNGKGPFDYKIKLSDTSELTETFNPELIFTDSQDLSGQGAESYSGTFILKVPSINGANSLEISKDGQQLASINLTDGGARPCKV